jgi:hypothetical protein
MTSRKKKPLPLPDDAPATTPASHESSLTQETADTPAVPAEGGTDATPARSWQPDPFVLMTVSLGAERDSPRMRLFRSNKLNQMAIGFELRPEEKYRVRLREDGWRWREDEGVWTKQLDRERRASSQLEAERLFAEIGEAIRGDLGLEPKRAVGS